MNFYEDCPESIRLEIQIIDLQPEENLLDQGDAPDYVYQLIEGEMQCFAITEKGLRHIIYIYQPGEIIGEVEVFTGELIITGAMATRPSRVYGISRKNFLEWFDSSPKFARYITGQLGLKLSNTFSVTSMNLNYSIKKQFMQHLYHAQTRHDGVFYVDKKKIAGILGCHYRSINRIVQDLTESELIHYHKGTFEIPDLVRFQEALRKQD